MQINSIERYLTSTVSTPYFLFISDGQYLSICTLFRLKDLNVGDSKVILLLRGLSSLIAELETDLRFDERRHSVIDKAECDISFTLADPSAGLTALKGFKAMLAELETGRKGRIFVNTAANLDKALFTVHHIRNAYEGIKSSTRGFTWLL